jgi:hypothetical protein
VLNDKTLALSTIRPVDPLSFRIEALVCLSFLFYVVPFRRSIESFLLLIQRSFLERQLGLVPFMKAYQLLANLSSDDEEASVAKQLSAILSIPSSSSSSSLSSMGIVGADRLVFVPLIHQLLFCESRVYS